MMLVCDNNKFINDDALRWAASYMQVSYKHSFLLYAMIILDNLSTQRV